LRPVDLDATSFPSLNVEAVLLSHAHLDHCGNLGLLDAKIPVIASPVSIALLKALLDSSPSKVGSGIAYYSEKRPADDAKVLCSGKIDIGRNFVCITEHSEDLVPLQAILSLFSILFTSST